MIYASFIDVRTTQQAGMQMLEDFKVWIETELDEEKAHQNFLYEKTNGRLDRKTERIEAEHIKLENRVEKLEHGHD